eukprot:2456526-Rhodomonas_salina.1
MLAIVSPTPSVSPLSSHGSGTVSGSHVAPTCVVHQLATLSDAKASSTTTSGGSPPSTRCSSTFRKRSQSS